MPQRWGVYYRQTYYRGLKRYSATPSVVLLRLRHPSARRDDACILSPGRKRREEKGKYFPLFLTTDTGMALTVVQGAFASSCMVVLGVSARGLMPYTSYSLSTYMVV